MPALPLDPASVLPEDADRAVLAARVWRPDIAGPSLCRIDGDVVVDVTSRSLATMRDLCETASPAATLLAAEGTIIGRLDAILANSDEEARDPEAPHLLAPVDLQAVKACGVTFIASLLERVIEEQARGAPQRAAALRAELSEAIGAELSDLVPGSPQAMTLKATLIEKGMWSQYLEVGIGRDPEVFTKSQPMSAVGHGASIGIHPLSEWNNPEPEIVLVGASDGRVVGATLGNDVNLRDVEGRSALLLGKAKDNNATAAIGPFLRLFDADFGMAEVRAAELEMEVAGEDGFVLDGRSSMSKIARPPEALVAATIGPHHHYPDGFALYLGTMFAPTKDRGAAGSGFTHHSGDVVRISTPRLGTLSNRVRATDRCAAWTFGAAALMRNLAGRGLL